MTLGYEWKTVRVGTAKILEEKLQNTGELCNIPQPILNK